jgi:hypothetical protein
MNPLSTVAVGLTVEKAMRSELVWSQPPIQPAK